MIVTRIAVGGLMLEKNEKWAWDVQHGIIIGRRDGDVGVLCIRHAQRDALIDHLTHEYCLETARQELNVLDGPVSDRDALDTPCGPYGAATYANETNVRRVWYCNRPPGMIYGVYVCPAEFARDSLYALIRGECAHLVSTAVFDRPSWGGDDPLTRILVEGMERAERNRE